VSKVLKICIFCFTFMVNSYQLNKKDFRCNIIDDIKINKYLLNQVEKSQNDQLVIGYYFFRNDKTKQIMGINLGCCMSKDEIFIFYRKMIPKKLIDFYDYRYKHGSLEVSPKKYIKDRLRNAYPISARYFVTQKGIKLGMSLRQVIEKYGLPDYIEILQFHPKRILEAKWQALGTAIKYYFKDIPDEKVCKDIDVYYEVSIKFVDDKAVSIHIRNEPP